MWLAGWIGRPWRRRRAGRQRILVTGTFYSDNWINAHLRPLAASKQCECLWVVSTYPVPPTPKLTVIYPPNWLKRCVGGVPARMLVFVWTAIVKRPDIIGGFHLLVNGLLAALLARLVGARSLYFCVGGPNEVLGGGIGAENRIFGRLKTPDLVVERRLIKAVGAFDFVITMGSRAITFFRQRGIETNFHVVSGGIDADRFRDTSDYPSFDLILVGRLAPN